MAQRKPLIERWAGPKSGKSVSGGDRGKGAMDGMPWLLLLLRGRERKENRELSSLSGRVSLALGLVKDFVVFTSELT